MENELNLEDFKTELYRRREGLLNQMSMLSSESKEYAELSKDYDAVNKAIDMMERTELDKQKIEVELKRIEADLKKAAMEEESKKRELSQNKKIEYCKSALGVGVLAVTIWQTLRITTFESENVITTKVFGSIGKLMNNIRLF